MNPYTEPIERHLLGGVFDGLPYCHDCGDDLDIYASPICSTCVELNKRDDYEYQT